MGIILITVQPQLFGSQLCSTSQCCDHSQFCRVFFLAEQNFDSNLTRRFHSSLKLDRLSYLNIQNTNISGNHSFWSELSKKENRENKTTKFYLIFVAHLK